MTKAIVWFQPDYGGRYTIAFLLEIETVSSQLAIGTRGASLGVHVQGKALVSTESMISV